MLPIISNNRGWNSISYQKTKVWYYGDIDEIIIKQLCKKIGNANNFNFNLFKTEVIKLRGKFAFIIQKNKNFNIAFVDRIKLVPIFFVKMTNIYRLSNPAFHLKDNMDANQKCQKSFFSMRMAGYCVGRKSLYKYLLQLLPHYPYFNYFNVIKEKKIERNALAWHVDNYLKLKKLI